MRLPEEFTEKMQRLLKEEYDKYIACYDEPRYYGLRVNTGKISLEEFESICPFEITPIPWIKNGYYYDGDRISPSKHPYYFAGLYYLQEPSAMTPADRLFIEPGDKVLDLCAAPGGKATELGARLLGQGVIAANDISNSRAKGLLKNMEVFGIGNLLVLNEEPGKLLDYFPEYFDKILIDAPCSGEGMFRKDKKMVKAWEEHGPEYFSAIQKDLILKAAAMLKPGGRMLYSTCTFDARENEQVIEHLLKSCPQFHVEEIEGYEGFSPGMPEALDGNREELKKTVRIFPHRMKGEGHFLALLRKGEDAWAEISEEKEQKSRKYKELPEELQIFLGDVRRDFDKSLLKVYGGRVYYMPDRLPYMKGIRFLRTGLLLGELKKNRFEPGQAFAMSLKKEEYAHVLNFPEADSRITKYLKGETLDVSDMVPGKDKGWQLVCVDGYPLGWGKLSGGTLKNKYLPGWRLV
ncbi:RsmB/NOP family class I SAM-dependent RNA methyltransferase [Lachnospiraceae bacterium 42-17]